MVNEIFRPIYYLGCKTNFAEAIASAINEVDPSNGRLCDLFAGTGAIAAALAQNREVTTVDVQEYSRILCSAVLSPAALEKSDISRIVESVSCGRIAKELLHCMKPLFDYELECIDVAVKGDPAALAELLEAPPLAARTTSQFTHADTRLNAIMATTLERLNAAGLLDSPDSTVVRYFGGVYFSYKQAAMLDALLAEAANAHEECGRDTLTAAALSTASSIVNTVGKQFAQPIRPRNRGGAIKANLGVMVKRDRSLDTLDIYGVWLGKYASLVSAACRPVCLRQDYLEALRQHASTYSVIYADPPYTRDHYSRFYHVLETMCLRDNPPLSRVRKGGQTLISRGIYREGRHQSPFCIRSAAPAAFDALFSAARESDLPVVLSYSPHELGDGTHPRVVSTKQIIEIATSYYNRVEIDSIEGSRHNLLNRNELKLKQREHAELIIKCFR